MAARGREMTDTPIQILYVDDEPALLEIGRLFLERSGDITVRTAESPHEGVKFLEDHAVDAIVSDYQMPHCDGIAFLKYLRSKNDMTPFIIFTGKGREDVVIEALNEGADFYLQKGGNPKAQFAELSNKIRYAVGKRRSEEALAASERQFNLLFEHMNAGFALHEILLDASGRPIDYRFLAINPAFEKLTGLSAERLIGRTVREVMPGTEEYWISTYGEVALTGASRQFENYSAALGKWYDVLVYSPAYGQFAVSIQDVTERRTAEAELRKSHDELHAANEQLAAAEEELRQQLDDLTEAQHALDETNEYLENLITHANAPIIVWDRSCRITRFNDAFGRLTGMLPEEAIGKEIQVLFPDETREASMALIRGAMTGEQWDVVEIPILNRYGDTRTVLWNSANIRGGDGETIIATIAQGQDITERKRAEEALLLKNKELDRYFTSSLDLLCIADLCGRFIRLNPEWEKVLGYTISELEGKAFLDFVHPDDIEKTLAAMATLEMEETVLNFENRYRCQDGSYRWIEWRSIPQEKMIYAAARDVTERKRTEEVLLTQTQELHAAYEELTASDEELRHNLEEMAAQEVALRKAKRELADIIEFLPDATFVIDRDQKVISWNRAMEEMTGVQKKEILNMGEYAYSLPFYRERRPILIDLVLSDDEDTAARYPFIRRDGDRILSEIFIPHLNNGRGAYLWFTASPLYDASGEVIGAIESIRDITDRAAALKELTERYRFDEIIRRIASGFIISGDFDRNIQKALAEIGSFCGASRSYIFEFREGEKYMDNTYEWCAEDVNPEIGNLRNLPTSLFPWWMAHLRREETIRIPDISLLPPEASAEREILEPQGIRSIIILPLTIRGELIGFIGLDNVLATREWSDEAVDLLRISSDLIGSAFERRQAWMALSDHNQALLQANEQLAAAEEEIRQQIDEITTTQHTLALSEERYQTIFEHTNAATIIIGKDTTISLANSAFEALSGHSKEEVIGKHWTDFVSESDRSRMTEYHHQRREGISTPPKNYEFSFIDRFGTIHPTFVTVGMIPGTHQSVASFYDISERKAAEEALQRSESTTRRRLQAILEPEGELGVMKLADILDSSSIQNLMEHFYRLTGIGVAVLDLNGKVLVSTGWQDICTRFHRLHPITCKHCIESDTRLSEGVAPGEFRLYQCKNMMWDIATPIMIGEEHLGNLFLGQFFFDDEIPDRERFRDQARRYGFDEEAYLDALDRVPRWSRETVDTVMRFYTGFTGVISSLSYANIRLARTLAERDALLRCLSESEEKYRRIVDTAGEGIWQMDATFRITYVNRRMADMLGYSPEEMHGADILYFIPYDEHADSEFRREKQRKGDIDHFERQFIRKDGVRVWCTVAITPIIDAEGIYQGSFAMLSDITERKNAEKRLDLAKKRLEILSSITRHDIANQVMAISAYLDLMQEGVNNPRQMTYLRGAASAAETIEDQIAFMRLYEEIGVTHPIWISLYDCINRIDAGNMCIRNNCLHTSIYADLMFEKVFANLMDNTLRHAEGATGVEIHCEEQNGDLVICWEDDGIGIPDDQKERIFVRGWGRHTGFGLFLSREILGITGITIRETGVYGKGARFEITVPDGGWQRVEER
jgi:PAS domain S-box-containing protein